jgi:hypothetical protein
MKALRILLFFFIGLMLGDKSQASFIDLGVVSFDNLIPAGTAPGVNVFTINNFTGDPAGGGFALPPDFPVYTNVGFLNSTLTIFNGASSSSVSLGDLFPGSYTPAALQFSETLTFTSAIFTATLSGSPLLLSDGTTFSPASLNLSVTLTPASGPTLQPGVDFAVLTTSDIATSAPEPSTWILLISSSLIYRPCRRWLAGRPQSA